MCYTLNKSLMCLTFCTRRFYLLSKLQTLTLSPPPPSATGKLTFLITNFAFWNIITWVNCFISYIGNIWTLLFCIYLFIYAMPIPVVERSKAWVCSRSPAGIAGSNPAEGMDICLLCVCQVEVSATGWSLVQRSLSGCGASLCVISKPQRLRRLKPASGL
jgi:hypothetical protein